MKKKFSVLIVLLIVSLISGCTAPISKNTSNLMANIERNNLVKADVLNLKDQEINRSEEITEFSLDIFSENFEDKNILISPLSIVSALGMLTNGASDNTLLEMEEALNSDIKGLNNYIKAYADHLPSAEKYQVSLANSIWFKDDETLTVDKDFLQTNKDYYDGSIYKAPFDESTKNDINAWVKDKTKGMIESLLNEAPSDNAIMYLINALSFDAEWEDIYEETQINNGEFILENGGHQDVEFMSSNEFSYLENVSSRGFMKPYKDNKYAFVALLPKENMSMSDFINSLKVKDLINLLDDKKDIMVYTQIPKFLVEYDTSLNESLKALGIIDAFDSEKADFNSLGKSLDGNIFINRVIHKTKIEVNEKGTKAGAVTAAEMEAGSALPEEPKEVILDRPFFYMIVDTEHNLPLFMGSLMNVN